ncbi:MAG: glycosyltransferase family 4 protein [Bacteroidetes bacterium]|nr:glycosyltransferase family 4 protein [Bacteroidota bacterium]MBL7067320.1 glycosyltransferase family 4 protein [Candidatus Neomarinimicrobiota bacterium]
MKRKKAVFVHYRVGLMDGVSLEIEKRRQILEEMGSEVKLVSGPRQSGADFIIDELEYDTPIMRDIKENCFKYFNKKTLDSGNLIAMIDEVSKRIEETFLAYHHKEKFDVIFLHNMFSLGLHISAASAFARIARKLNIPVIATHHDFYWERKDFLEPVNEEVAEYLETYVPPLQINNIIHVCINSLAQAELKRRKGISTVVIPDVFDFKQKSWTPDKYNSDLLQTIGVKPNDLVILQATRIVKRKGIELTIQFVRELERQKDKLTGKTLYNGKAITNDSNIVLILAGYAEEFDKQYLKNLKDEITTAKIKAKFINSIVGAERSCGDKKIYSLWDLYVFSDLITYPSIFEGWGNQFIEAVFAKKPIVLFEYPVFISDIKKEGYFLISLGSKIRGNDKNNLIEIDVSKVNKAAIESIKALTSKETNILLDRNFEIGARYHDYNVLREFLTTYV